MGGELFTAGSAFLAAITGLYSAYQLKSAGRDKIRISLWGVGFDTDPITKLHVVNLRDHRTVIADWGFINESGVLYSTPVALEFAWREEGDVTSNGSTVLNNKAEIFEHGTSHVPENVVGAYAITATQKYPRFCIKPTLPLSERVVYRIKTYTVLWDYFWSGTVMYDERRKRPKAD